MARRRAKIVIVEGPSDNTALSVYLRLSVICQEKKSMNELINRDKKCT